MLKIKYFMQKSDRKLPNLFQMTTFNSFKIVYERKIRQQLFQLHDGDFKINGEK